MWNYYREAFFYPLMQKRLGNEKVRSLRQEVLASAQGEVLEIGFGSGTNLDCYPDSIQAIHAIDIPPFKYPNFQTGIKLDLVPMSAEAMAFPDAVFDSVVSTFTLCSIPDVEAALKEIHRVLKPKGVFLFLEHGKSPNRCIAAMQCLLNPFYRLLACGCNVNRDMLQIISSSGLSLKSTRTALYGLPFSGFYFSGIATKAGDLC
jgi:ubiquinone/menaquinone biosynthesis C-methylase UbiE